MQATPRDRIHEQRMRFDGEDFAGSELTSVHPSASWFVRCDFSGADLRLATFDRCVFTSCQFRGAILQGASLREVQLAGCDFTDADLRNCDLTAATFSFVNTGNSTGRTDVTGAMFDGARQTGLVMDRVVGWPEDQR